GRAEEAKRAASEAFDLIAEPDRNALLLVRILSDLRSPDLIVSTLGRMFANPSIVAPSREQTELIARYAIALDQEGRSHEAQGWLKFAADNGPCHRLVIRNLVRILVNLKQIDEAQQVIDRMVARQSHEKWAWIEAIEGAILIGRPDAAAEYFETASASLGRELVDWLDLAERAKVPGARK